MMSDGYEHDDEGNHTLPYDPMKTIKALDESGHSHDGISPVGGTMRPSNIRRIEDYNQADVVLEAKLRAAEVALRTAQERIAYLELTRDQALDEIGQLQTRLVHLQARIRDLEHEPVLGFDS